MATAGVAGPLPLIGCRRLLPFLLLPLLRLAHAGCPSGCVCASDILSCADRGLKLLPSPLPASAATLDLSHNELTALPAASFAALPRLLALRLAHNRLATLDAGAFANASLRLRHLDLSSNRLRLLERRWFDGLPALQELLLFDNRVARVESLALSGLGALRRLYLSHNVLTDFPFFSVGAHTHPHLSVLDLSSNRLPRLPLDEIRALPPRLQRALFLHNNSLTCECDLFFLFRRWELRGYASVRDYRREHVCWLYGDRRAAVRFLEHSGVGGGRFENCSLAPPPPPPLDEDGEGGGAEPQTNLLGYAGEPLVLDCATPLGGGAELSYLWVLPQQAYVSAPGSADGSLRVFANGSLGIAALRADVGGGVYLCMAQERGGGRGGGGRNETWEVNVTVASRQAEAESFNTGFTTLLGCLVSLLLVLVYLYLTPCRCCCRPRRRKADAPPPTDARASVVVVAATPPPVVVEGTGRKVSSNKHVVFLEPPREQNGRPRVAPPPPRLLPFSDVAAAPPCTRPSSISSSYSPSPLPPN